MAFAEDKAPNLAGSDRTDDAPCFNCAKAAEEAVLAAADGEKRCAAYGAAKECLLKEESATCRERVAGRELHDRLAARCGVAGCTDVCPKATKCANCVKEYITLRRTAREKFEAKRTELGDANFDKDAVVAEFKREFCTAAARLFTTCREAAAKSEADGGDGRPCSAPLRFRCAYKALCTDTPCERPSATGDRERPSTANVASTTDVEGDADVISVRSRKSRFVRFKAREVLKDRIKDRFDVRRENRAKNDELRTEFKPILEEIRQEPDLIVTVTDGPDADNAVLTVENRGAEAPAPQASASGVLAASFALLALVLAFF